MKRKNNHVQNKANLRFLYIAGFLLSISTALPAFIQSNFLNQFIKLESVSLVFIFAHALNFIFILNFPKLIKRFTNFFLSKTILIIYALALLNLSLANSPAHALISFIFLIISNNLLFITLDVLIESFSHNETTGRTRATYFTFNNLGWIIAPFLSSRLIDAYGYSLSFLVAAILVIPVFLIFIKQGKHLKDKVAYKEGRLFSAIKNLFKNKNLRSIFFIATLLQIFYSTAVVYIPIYLHQNLGMDWEVLGVIFSIMLIPFVLIEIPAGIIADKHLGEKEFLYTGLAILTLSLFLFYYIKSDLFLVWAGVLFFSRIGAALIEAMRESYFFKIVDVEDVDYINIFRTATPLGYIIGSVLAILILLFLPLQYLFLLISILMLTGFIFTTTLQDTK
ncbi:MFS transporter [Candidatus Falkowbacteria bacterium]|jgi:predicted MFS family arabinose efflux permease|nr:MFS transporter [Candidatus Falkowbacteria bacterium]